MHTVQSTGAAPKLTSTAFTSEDHSPNQGYVVLLMTQFILKWTFLVVTIFALELMMYFIFRNMLATVITPALKSILSFSLTLTY